MATILTQKAPRRNVHLAELLEERHNASEALGSLIEAISEGNVSLQSDVDRLNSYIDDLEAQIDGAGDSDWHRLEACEELRLRQRPISHGSTSQGRRGRD